MKKILITGALGQNGQILSKIYIKKKFKVFGFVKRVNKNKIRGVKYYTNNLKNKITIEHHIKKISPLKKVGLNELPKYVSDNIDKYSKWID